MPHTTHRRRAIGGVLALAGALGFTLFAACQEPAGPPPTLEPGSVSFSYAGGRSGTFAVDGRCYWSDGYPAADSTCALALDLGDTIRIRATRDPRTIRWIHVNIEFPESGTCDGSGGCRLGMDFLSPTGKAELSYRSTALDVTVQEMTEERLQGTFAGSAYDPDGAPRDTIRIFDGVFDVPVER